MTSDREDLIVWGHSALTVVLEVPEHGPVRLVRLDAARRDDDPSVDTLEAVTQPIVELAADALGSDWSGPRSVQSIIGDRLRFVATSEESNGPWLQLTLELRDPISDLRVQVTYRSIDGVSALQSSVRLIAGVTPITLRWVTSFAAGSFGASADDVDVLRADSDWLAEGRWHRQGLRDAGLPDLDLALHQQPPRGSLSVASDGAWSSARHLPMGALVDRKSGRAWAWQIEHNGAWRWEVGERLDGIYLATFGPTEANLWEQQLLPGQEFTTVPVAVAVADTGFESAVAALTSYRRHLVRPHPDRGALPVVFNDYMNTLMGDPTTQRLLPLVEAAARSGAEYFCIDAGWYAEDGDWWDSVGAWVPSTTRFPEGLAQVIDAIRDAGMVPGLWLEPEVVGVNSPVAQTLPDAAFFQRGGSRRVENGRFHLDLRHPAAVEHLDGVVDRLVREFGIGYFKLDYNIDPGPGTDHAASAPGTGMLEHGRAYLAWLDAVLDRHPELVLENCASGGMRMDYALLARLQLQSTSDQRNPARYAPIAAAAPALILPEQAANWAYPQPDMSLEEIAFTMCTGTSGRLYLSGHLNEMSEERAKLVRSAVETYRSIRHEIARAVPFWPLDLPAWEDGWICLGLQGPQHTYLTTWRRAGAPEHTTLPIPHLAGADPVIELLYPTELEEWELHWRPEEGQLGITALSDPPGARLFRLTPRDGASGAPSADVVDSTGGRA